ncbi:MAG: HAMP domain-containing sensor histidine kinase [Agathobacter sp.]|nr:HAMP domain-containing sensor histidine kinase [Agathobacter sp.]
MKKQRISISSQLSATMILLVAGIFLIFWIVNGCFLEKYYLFNKKNELLDAFEIVNDENKYGDMTSESFQIKFYKICGNGNIDMMIYINQFDIVISSLNDTQRVQLYADETFGKINGANRQILVATDDYVVMKTTDRKMKEEYLTLNGTLNDGSSVYMRTAVESLKESASITNRFFLWVGCASLILSLGVIYYISKRISRPIQELTTISKRMSELEFDAKYSRPDYATLEIDELGVNMNQLSKILEETISELKSANVELQHDIEKKEKIDEMRKEFLSNVSHELKTPLALIQGYSEGLKECINDDDESRDFYCDVIIDETEKMNNMVKKLLTLNQLEFGNDMVEMTRFDITELIQGVINASSLLAAQKEITINFDGESPAYVWGDEFKVEEVITNYLSNAINHADNEKRIDIFYTKKDNILRVSVFNTGKLIPEDELEKVWIKFYKVDKARTREYGGNGIGLSIVKAIMDSFNQKCGVFNHEDGVEFWMELESNN